MTARNYLGDPGWFRRAIRHLSKADSKLAEIISAYGVLEFNARGGLFESLSESIMSQQLGARAADAIIERVKTACGGSITPKSINRLDTSRLRRAGLSLNKARYLKGLASLVIARKLDLDSLVEKDDEELIKVLDEIKGVGPWTVHMLLIFALGRPDVLPVDDFAIRKAIQRLYDLKEIPGAAQIEKIAKNWHPYCSAASLYLWRSNDSPEQKRL